MFRVVGVCIGLSKFMSYQDDVIISLSFSISNSSWLLNTEGGNIKYGMVVETYGMQVINRIIWVVAAN